MMVLRDWHTESRFNGGVTLPLADPVVVFEWEVILSSSAEGEEQVGSCGTTGRQDTAMDRLGTALRALDAPAAGRIRRRVYTWGMTMGDWSTREVMLAAMDTTGTIHWTPARNGRPS